MKFLLNLKKSIKTVKIVLAIFAVLASIAGVVTAIFLWKKKKDAEKLETESIDNLIDEQLNAVDIDEGEAIVG